QQLLGEDGKKRLKWKEEILQAIEPNACVLLDLVPELENIVGEQPHVQELPAEEAKNRFLITTVNFLKIFARVEHPLVIFLDDLHWSDGATLSLLQNILCSFRIPYLFVIGAYRDNLIDDTHPMQLALDNIDRLKGIRKIKLKPLRKSVVAEIIGDTLHCSETEAEELTGIIHQKTRGNPFFINEMLKNLYNENHLK
ncbi:MAG: AAA family ATPase, partial [Proteobacteria bacterium]|nr:AAA family ATPase [Pseudomonadota bacterium]